MTVAALETLRARVAGHPNWYHRIELGPGLVTPGGHDSQNALRALDRLGLPAVCTGLRVLDIGCRDGFFAFELERRGARVVGLDYADPAVTGFSIAAEALDSRVQYRVMNVYDLDPQRHGLFEIVLFLGMLYHLRNPMLALDRVRAVTRPGGLVFVETQVASDAAATGAELPTWRYYPRDSLRGDETNKWAPNVPGLRAMLEDCQLMVEEVAATRERATVRARSVANRRLEYYRKLDAGARIWGQGGRPVD
jgi:tRNA (mo5U34)-methyltransferase